MGVAAITVRHDHALVGLAVILAMSIGPAFPTGQGGRRWGAMSRTNGSLAKLPLLIVVSSAANQF